MMYSKIIYNQAPIGGGYTRPTVPATYGNIVMISPTWNPYSANPDDRAEYYEDTNGTIAITDYPLTLFTRAMAKLVRADKVNAIVVVTHLGNSFSGDETSQNRMARAIIALNAQPQSPIPTITWVQSNNIPVVTTAAELTEALALSGAAQSAVWVI